MEVILKKDVIGLGEEGDIQKVKPGYARNYLIPYGHAVKATISNRRILDLERDAIENRKEKKREESKSIAERLDGLKIVIEALAGDSNKLFGSVSNTNIADKLAEEGFEIDRKRIELDSPIKTIGNYTAKVKFYQGIVANIEIVVKKEGEEEIEEEILDEVVEDQENTTETAESTETTETMETSEPTVETESTSEGTASPEEQEEEKSSS